VAKLQSGSHVFVSYAHADAEYVLRLTDLLAERDIAFWFDRARLRAGDAFNREIMQALDGCGAFILVMTPASEQSRYVQKEFARATKRGVQVLPFLLEGEDHFNTGDLQYTDLQGGELPPESVLAQLRDLTRPPTSVAPSFRGPAVLGPTQVLTLDEERGIVRFVVESDPAGTTVRLVDGQIGHSQRVLSCDAGVEQLILSPDGSLVAVNEAGSLRLAEVGGRGVLSPWEVELDLAATFDVSDRAALVGLGRSTSRFDPCADLLISDGMVIRRFRVDRAGRWRRSPGVSGSEVVRAAAAGDGYLALIDGGELLAVGYPLESFLATGTWSDIDAAVGDARAEGRSDGGSGGRYGHVELVAAVRVEDGDAQLIAWRRLGGGQPEVRGLDLEVGVEGGKLRVDVVRPRAGGEPERILVTAGRHTLGWLWDELAPVDPERLVAGGVPS
jgi:hypothetical protein